MKWAVLVVFTLVLTLLYLACSDKINKELACNTSCLNTVSTISNAGTIKIGFTSFAQAFLCPMHLLGVTQKVTKKQYYLMEIIYSFASINALKY